MNKLLILLVVLITFSIIYSSCKTEDEVTIEKTDTTVSQQQTTPDQYARIENVTVAIAELNSASGSNVRGFITFKQTDSGMFVTGEIHGLTPGMHGFHIHEFGDCSAPDATSAGDHFNPGQMPHAGHGMEKRHVGDMGNIDADDQGNVRIQLLDNMMKFDGENNILGKSVIVHEKEDDLRTQPSGDAGARIACGIVTPVRQE
jgi:Cu-Zn family superoxide dismutase